MSASTAATNPPPPPKAAADARPHPHVGRLRLTLATIVCAVSAVTSGLLLLEHHGEPRAAAAVSQVCGEGAQSGCDTVLHSRFSEVRGMPLAAVGLLFVLSVGSLLLLSLLAGPESHDAAAALALLAFVVALAADVVLLGVQVVAIRAFCRLCLLTYALNALALVLLLPARRDGAVVGEAVTRRDGRLVFAGWALTTLALVLAVYAVEKALDSREKTRNASILGTVPPAPMPAFVPRPVEPGSDAQRYQEEARVATEQARRLQEILDDPKKLDQYFAQKAAREFDANPVFPLKLDGVPVKGAPQGPIKVVEFSDFLCPFCRSIAGAFTNYLPQTANRVTVYYKNYPLDAVCNPNVKQTIHEGACWLAMGGLCAHDQNAFWPYHDKVFSTQIEKPEQKDVVQLATEAGLDGAAMQACLASGKMKGRLAAEIEEAREGGVSATPTLFINGKRLPRINDFVATVDKESGRLGLGPMPKPQ
jgi:protein-disulfide isomerase